MSEVDSHLDPLAEVIDRLIDQTPALLLLRYRAARLPSQIISRLAWHAEKPRCHMVEYLAEALEGAPGSASAIIAECVHHAASTPPPVLLLAPRYQENGTLEPSAAAYFWKQLNIQRETLGNLNARVLLCLDPGHEPYATTHARDMLSWCAPKFALMADYGMGTEEAEEQNRKVASEEKFLEDAHEAAQLQRRALGPLWNDVVSAGRSPSLTEIERLGLPLLTTALDEGRLADASALDQSIAAARLPRSSARGSWLRLHGDLARALGRFPEAEGAYIEAIELQESLLRESPGNPRFKRDLLVSLNQFAVLLTERGQTGDLARVLPLHERALRLNEQVLAANPESTQGKRDLSVSLGRL